MKKKQSNLAAKAPEKEFSTLEERVLRSDLSEQDKIEIIKIIGRQGAGNIGGWTTYTPLNIPGTTTTSPYHNPDVVYCSCCVSEE